MKYFLIIIVCLVGFVGDGIVFPALTGLPSGFGVMVLLSALVITFGAHRWLISLGIILAGIAELMLGTYFGVIIGAWLAMTWVWHFLNQFLNIKPTKESNSIASFLLFTLLGLGLFGFGECALWVINRFIYEPQLAVTTLVEIFSSPVIFGIVVIEFAITLFVFRFIYLSQENIYA